MEKFIPEPLVWELIEGKNAGIPEEVDIKIYKHKKNFGNNGDKYLVVLRAESQNMLFSENYDDYNTCDYDVLSGGRYEKDTMAFVVVGNIEIGSIINLFKK